MREQLAALLEEKQGEYVSGEQLSRILNVSRTAVWKHIRKLEEEGYKIEASRKLGYRLVDSPDQITLTSLLPRLTTVRLGRSVKLFDEVDSTQNIAQKLAEEGAPEGTLILAERQLSGRGRMGRSWLSPKGRGVWMSMILRPTIPLPYTPQLTLLTAVALCRALRRLTGLEIGIKWPNDLLIDGRKISGILLESSAEEERLRHVIVGVGISVNLDKQHYTEDMLDRVISLKMAAGITFDRSEIIAGFLAEFEAVYTLYEQEGFAPVRSLWEALSVSLHKPCKLTTPQGIMEGIPVGLADSGALLLKLEDGDTVPVFSAEMG
ncbi:biotin--[acetyl-CoA-carboxylase] ligase [Paenibacillus sambharensis]|uniref:Bifunctional ligase/repressor BirA n=1 Tax=Paenibacillus sambharensis TaxID=1803190 RepID=A0A2W1LGH8_9BACL|nr:biotin--[acetyl-CoA-carboxylase] ligase [Paenibacillus sambharensis]PZD93564.1 biotin--[acetyl-CoA-carboxylase] ligase [Paenibacillus sambharensis]